MDRTLACRLLGLDYAAAQVTGPPSALASRHPVTELLTASIVTAGLAYARWCGTLGQPLPTIGVDTRAAAAAGRSQAYASFPGGTLTEWAPLSGWALASDGWMRLHANYDHHRAALCKVLGIPPERAALEAAVASWRALELETALAEGGAVGVAVRTPGQWESSAPGEAVQALPLLSVEPRGGGRAIARSPRVLDLTRVIAGPVGTRMLGLFGADVLRLDRPDRPEQDMYVDTGLAKRSALLDLRGYDVDTLLADADVVVSGYRPGALAALGLQDALDRHPQLVVVELSAWGSPGAWSGRRGFDSLVQAATGIGVAEGTAEKPGALPVQALDHATGYLIAACAWDGLARRAADGVGRRYRLSLAQTARWLGPATADASGAVDLVPELQTLEGGYGRTSVLAPPFAVDGRVPHWPFAAERPGTSLPQWL